MSRTESDARKRRRRGLGWWLVGGLLGLLAALIFGRRRPARERPAPPPPAPAELPAGATLSWVPGAGGGLRLCEVHPEGGLTLVFVHGLGGRLEHWGAQLAALGPGLRGVAFDLPGHGGSDPAASGDYGVGALAGALGAVADALALRRFVLVAHSLGALVALRYAAAHAGRVSGLLLVDPSGDATHLPEEERRALLESVRRDPRGEIGWQFRQLLADDRPEVAERVLADLEATPEEALYGSLAASMGHSPVPDLARLVVPIRSLTTAHNRSPHGLHRLVPELPVSPIGGTGHWPMLDDPDAVNRVLDGFLDEVRAHRAAQPA
ncbi:MAG: alpha/beta fold hydrolase [Acidobacteria bacterium]|nr:MAG: alpha/beta fold hydrolase [Acidobacteriota bacterium]